jgi:phosphate starvation-inducible membrane PsiE
MSDVWKGLSVTTLIIFYLYFCGALYLTSFWNTFHLNVTGMISISDIPKSFAIPLD